MRHILLRYIILNEGSENRLFYLTFSNIKEFLSLYIPNLNRELNIFVIGYNVYGVYITVVIEKVNEKCICDPLLGLD